MRLLPLLTLLLLLAVGCRTQQPPPSDDADVQLRSTALERLGDEYQIIPNADSTYALAQVAAKRNPPAPFGAVRFFVYDMAKNEVVHEGRVAQGTVKWVDAYTLEVQEVPGIVQQGDPATPQGYRFDVRTGTEQPLGNSTPR